MGSGSRLLAVVKGDDILKPKSDCDARLQLETQRKKRNKEHKKTQRIVPPCSALLFVHSSSSPSTLYSLLPKHTLFLTFKE